jgi:hypothetical protein
MNYSNSSNTLNHLVLSTESATKEQVQVRGVPTVRRSVRSRKNTENAIYAYIRAIRALGRKEINTSEIADALSLPILEVNRAIASLKKKGVRALNA